MKKHIIFVNFFIFVSSMNLAANTNNFPPERESNSHVLRIFGAFGYTFVGNSLTETYGANQSEGITRDPLGGGLGLHFLTGINHKVRLGLEMNMSRWFGETADNGNHLLVSNDKQFCYRGLVNMAVMELKISRIFFLQTGFGMFSAFGVNNSFLGTSPYFMTAIGMDMPVTEKISIPVMVRISSFETDSPASFSDGNGFGSVVPVFLIFGITFKI